MWVPTVLHKWELSRLLCTLFILLEVRCWKNLCVPLYGVPYLFDWSVEAQFVCAHAQLLQQCLPLCYSMEYIALQGPLSIGFSRQEYWGCHAILLFQGSNLHLLCALPAELSGKRMKHIGVLHILSCFLHYLFVCFLFISSYYSIF